MSENKSFIKILCEQFRSYDMKKYVLRLLGAFFMCLAARYIIVDIPYDGTEYYGGLSLGIFLAGIFVIFATFCLIENDTPIYAIMVGSATVYLVMAAYDGKDYHFSIGLSALICVVVAFFNMRVPKRDLPGIPTKVILTVMMTVSAVFVGYFCCLYVLNYMTHCYDFGLFAQMFHYMKETGECLTTCERDGLLSHFAVHFSPIYYVILPIYMLIPHPCTLVVAQAVIVASGVIPLYLLCKQYGLRNFTAVAFSAVYLLYPPFLGGCFWYLHENCFLAPMILWYFYFSEKGYKWQTLLMAFGTLLIKEDAPVYVAVIALYFILAGKNRKTNIYIMIMSVAYFLVVTTLMGMYGLGIMSDSRYGEYIYDDGGLFTVIKAVIQNPAYAVKQIFKKEKLLFLLQTSMPFCFLQYAVKKPVKVVLFIPYILVNLMTNYVYQYDVGFQYVFGSGTILLYLAVTNYAEMGETRRKALLSAVLSSVIIFSGGYFRKTDFIQTWENHTEKRETINEAMTYIPEGKSVAASSLFVTMLSHTDELYMLEDTKQEADVIVVDLRYATGNTYADECEEGGFKTLFFEEGIIGIYERVE